MSGLTSRLGHPWLFPHPPAVPMPVPHLAYGKQHSSKDSILQEPHLLSPQLEKPRPGAGALVGLGPEYKLALLAVRLAQQHSSCLLAASCMWG